MKKLVNIFDFNEFVNQKTNESINSVNEYRIAKTAEDDEDEDDEKIKEPKVSDSLTVKEIVLADIADILDVFFDEAKDVTYEYNSDGLPTELTFEVTNLDYNVDYEPLGNEFSKGVLKKHPYKVELEFGTKFKKGSKYFITFDVELELVPDFFKNKIKNKTVVESDELFAKLANSSAVVA